MKKYFFLAILLLACRLAAAEDSQAYLDCQKKSESSDVALKECNQKELDRLDKALNEVYRDLTKKIEAPARKALLKKSENAWIAFRDSQCEFASSAEKGGTISTLIAQKCEMEVISSRIQQLTLSSKLEF